MISASVCSTVQESTASHICKKWWWYTRLSGDNGAPSGEATKREVEVCYAWGQLSQGEVFTATRLDSWEVGVSQPCFYILVSGDYGTAFTEAANHQCRKEDNLTMATVSFTAPKYRLTRWLRNKTEAAPFISGHHGVVGSGETTRPGKVHTEEAGYVRGQLSSTRALDDSVWSTGYKTERIIELSSLTLW